jgi:hypothetical protein
LTSLSAKINLNFIIKRGSVEEKVFFEDGANKVTNTRFVVGAQTYALSGITSVRIAEEAPKYKIHSMAGGAVAILGGLGQISDSFVGGIALIAIGAALVWFGKNMKTTYHVVTVSSGGESQALSSTDQTLISNIVNAITEAIIHRG